VVIQIMFIVHWFVDSPVSCCQFSESEQRSLSGQRQSSKSLVEITTIIRKQ